MSHSDHTHSNPNSFYGTPGQPIPPDLPFLAPTALSVRDSASTTPMPYGDYDATPGTPTNSAPLLPPTAGVMRDSSRYDSVYDPPPEGFASNVGFNKESASPYVGSPSDSSDLGGGRKRPFWKKPWVLVLTALAVAIIAAAIVVPVVLVNHHKSSASTTGAAASSTPTSTSGGGGQQQPGGDGGPTKPVQNLVTWGGDGSTVTKEDGSTFVYQNSFGGFWVSDPANPFNNSAKPNSWTPAIGEKWTWGQNRIWGVNLGGFLVLEPFIVPSLYQTYAPAADEWTLSQLISSSTTANNNLTAVLSDHYANFITEEDIAQIAGAGLNWIRLPIPFWAIETWADVGEGVGEPFLARVCWQYILRVLGWARKYGLRVNLDLHTIPGSQNGYNHSGKIGQVNFMNGVMGAANAERTLDYIRIITEFISQPEWKDVVPMFSIINEALVKTIGQDQMTSFYLKAHDMIREITGLGEGNGPFMMIHDGFMGPAQWFGFLPGSDRIGIDQHPYFAFNGQPNGDPIAVPADGGDGTMAGGKWPLAACNSWGGSLNNSRNNFGVTIAGEFSNAINDCGLYIRGTTAQPSTSAPCPDYNDWQNWNATMKDGFMNFMLASMDALGDYFFWTWKIGNDTQTGIPQAPLWSYQLGLENGWIPKDPRQAIGMCARLGVQGTQFDGSFQPWQTGGAGAGTIAATATDEFGTFPPTSMAGVPAGQVSLLPTYTATKTPVVTLPPPAFASATASIGNGWFDAQDSSPMVTAVSGCTYPDAWSAQDSPVPAAACPAAGGAGVPPPAVTPPPAPAGAGAVVPSASTSSTAP